MSTIKKKHSASLAILIFFSSCATSPIPTLGPGIVSPNEIRPLDDPIWSDIASWPEKIRNGNVEYAVSYRGENTANETTFDVDEIDRRFHYFADYDPVRKVGYKYKESDYFYGPFFGWRPDGTIFIKAMGDEKGRYEFYYYYKNGQIAEQEFVDRNKNIHNVAWFDENGNKVGYSAVWYDSTWDKAIKQECEWKGQVFIDCTHWEFKAKGRDYINKENAHNIW